MKRSAAFPFFWAIALQLLLALPYLFALAMTPPHFHFVGLIYNPDDPYVYLSWMRQAVDGHLLFRNLFTLEPQRGVSFHVLFLLLGRICRATGLSLAVVYHLARVFLGMVFVLELGVLIRWLESDPVRQRWILVMVSLGAGLGWIYFLFASPIVHPFADNTHIPTDLWMTESVPFQSLLLNPLFTCAYCLLLGSFLCLLRAERDGKARWSALAGFLALLLGNIHSYDVLILHPVWILFLIVVTLRAKAVRQCWPGWSPARGWARYALALAISSPAVAYQWWVLQVEPVFRARALVPTLSPPPQYFWMGIGLSLPLAFAINWKRVQQPVQLWLGSWCLCSLALPYFPFSFQWKLAFGLDLPFLVLAAIRLVGWIQQVSRPDLRRVLLWLTLAIAALSNVLFVVSDLQLLELNQSNVFPPLYATDSEWSSLQWLRAHHRPEDRVLCWPRMGNLIPAVTGDAVFVGHWGETAHFGAKLSVVRGFFTGQLSPADAAAFLKANRITYVYDGIVERSLLQSPGASNPFPNLPVRQVYAAGSGITRVIIYQVAQ